MRKASAPILISLSLAFVLLFLLLGWMTSFSTPARAAPDLPWQPMALSEPAITHTAFLPMSAKNYAGLPYPGLELKSALAGELTGTQVTILGSFSGNDAAKFNHTVQSFELQTGIDIQYESSADFTHVISDRVKAGTAPDIAAFPVPGLLSYFARQGQVLDLATIIQPAWLRQNYSQSLQDMATMPGPSANLIAGIWFSQNIKSLVWYPKEAFDLAGYQVPLTWTELFSLTQQMAADGKTPWCVGIESGAATGWPATDWVEDLMLRTTSLGNYDQWVHGDLQFNSPEVKRAIGYMTAIWFNDAYVYGGRSSIATTFFGDAANPMFDQPPGCWFHRQASFMTSFFPSGKVYGKDYAFFYLPPVDAQYGKPVLMAGDLYAAFHDRPEVRAVIQYLSTGESIKGWVQAGGILAPQRDASLDWYPAGVDHDLAELYWNANSYRFDGSDLMPAEVGAGTFWTELTQYVEGTISLEDALNAIDASWPH